MTISIPMMIVFGFLFGVGFAVANWLIHKLLG